MFYVNEDVLISAMDQEGIILRGHFLLSSGRHSAEYVNKDIIYCKPKVFSEIIINLNSILHFLEPYKVITGPAVAGAILAVPIALALSKIFVYPEKKIRNKMVNGETLPKKIMEFRQVYKKVICGERAVIVEDIITTGSSVRQTIEAINLCGGEVVGIVAIWNRGHWRPPANIKLVSLVNQPIRSWAADECPLCKDQVPLIDIKTGLRADRYKN